MIDLHCHLLPEIDDGPASLAASIELARAAWLDGCAGLVATPHVSFEWQNDSGTVAAGVERLKLALAAAEIPIEVLAGAEVAGSYVDRLSRDELGRLCLGHGDAVLLECPLSTHASAMDQVVAKLHGMGYRVVLAHPERSPALQRNPDLLKRMVAGGALTSITAGALGGDFGSRVRSFALWMLERDLVHNVASDFHDLSRRRPGLKSTLLAAADHAPGLEHRLEWLTEEVPRAIVIGAPVPGPPAGAIRSVRWFPRLRRRLGSGDAWPV